MASILSVRFNQTFEGKRTQKNCNDYISNDCAPNAFYCDCLVGINIDSFVLFLLLQLLSSVDSLLPSLFGSQKKMLNHYKKQINHGKENRFDINIDTVNFAHM